MEAEIVNLGHGFQREREEEEEGVVVMSVFELFDS